MRWLSFIFFLAALTIRSQAFAYESRNLHDTLDIALVNPGLAFQVERYVDEQVILALSTVEFDEWNSEFYLLVNSKQLNWNFSNANLSVRIDTLWLHALLDVHIAKEKRVFRFRKNLAYKRRKVETEFIHKGNYDSGYRWFADYGMPVGKYKLRNDIRSVNERNSSRLSIIDFQAPGSSNAFCSLVLPGWGMYRVSFDRRKTSLAGGMVLLPLIVSVLSESISVSAYQKYIGAYGEESQGYYSQANSWHRISLVSAGLTCIAYATQVSWTVKLGLENKKEEHMIRRIINSENWYIENQ